MNQSMNMKINHQEKSINTRWTQWFFPEVHVLAGTLRPCCVDHHFVVRRLIGNPKPSSPRAPQEPNVSEITQWHEQFTRATLRRFAGEGATPLTRSPELATNNHQRVPDLHRCSKSSRWRQPSRVTRITQLNRSPSTTRCKFISKYT
jgi:hypothetical protein